MPFPKFAFWLIYLDTLLWFVCPNPVYAHGVTIQAHQYITRYRDLAISEMYRTGIPASIKLAQGMFESQNGNSALAQKANNHFGIKCKSDWEGDTLYHDDDAPQECFRKYASAEESFIDHSNILQQRDRYLDLFSLSPTDYVGWAKGLKKAGYATLATYDQRLIQIIEQYQLYEYDLGGTPQPAIAENLNKGEAAIFTAHAPKGTKPKRNAAPAGKSDLASLDDAMRQSLAQRPNIPLQQLSGAPAVMPNVKELNTSANPRKQRHAKPNKPAATPPPAAPTKIQTISDLTAQAPITAPPKPKPKPAYTEPPLPTPPSDPTPDYLMPQYDHQTIVFIPDNASFPAAHEPDPANIVAVAERATAAPAAKLSAAEAAAARRKDSPMLPPQKFNYVNDAKTVTYPYEVSVAQIAKTYRLAPEQIVKYNDLKNENTALPAKQNIFLMPKSDKCETKLHLVAQGETLWSIAQRYGISLNALCEKNKLTPKLQPLVGERLYLKANAPKAPRYQQIKN